MASDIDTLHKKIEQYQQRLALFQKSLDELPETAHSVVAVLAEELSSSMEELRVAEEELREQHETLQQTREDLETERQRYRDLFEFAPDAYIITDLHGAIREANQAAVRLLNLDTKFLIGKPLPVFIVFDEHALFRARLAALHRGELPEDFELQILPRQTWQPISVSASSALIYDAGGHVIRVHWSLRNITDRKQLEEQLRKLNTSLESRVHERTLELEAANRQKDELLVREQTARAEAERANESRLKFLAMISHELRTPLTSIKGFASTLLADDVVWEPERWQMFIGIIDEEADKLTELVEHLLDLSRLQAGTLSITIQPMSVSEILKQAELQSQVLINEHHLHTDVPEELPLVAADPRRIAQVIANLISNAVKYAPTHTEIAIAAAEVNHEVQISVSDQGPGIPESERERVFEVFYQLATPEMKRQGAGLGLAICKGLIERHGGKIWIEDRAEPGTTISFTLPLVK
jgi:PAS domain S-box-containing protein